MKETERGISNRLKERRGDKKRRREIERKRLAGRWDIERMTMRKRKRKIYTEK